METNLLTLIILVGLSGFFSGIELAYFSLSPGRVRSMVRRGQRFAPLVEKLKSNPQRLLITVLVGNNIVNISAASIATKIALDAFGSAGVGIASGVVTLIVLIFGEIVPKSLAQMHADTISRWSAPLVSALEIILWPLVFLFEKLTYLLHMLSPGSSQRMQVSEEEIQAMMHVGVEEGSVERHERQFVERLFRFNDMPLLDIMTPMTAVYMLESTQLVKDVVQPAAHSGYSRFPVYTGEKKNVIGLVHIKDILRSASRSESERVKDIVSPVVRAKSDMLLDDAFRLMQGQHQHAYLVTDTSDGAIGLVTMEDIIEELLGEIRDESDSRKGRRV